MKRMLRYITWIFLIVPFVLLGQNLEANFETGNDHYANGRYQEAIDAYKSILDAGQESAALYYNLANAHYKLNNVAPSVYYYEKAKQLSPADADIQNNAAFAENMKIDAIDTLPENTVKKTMNKVIDTFTIDGWAITAVIFIILAVLLCIGYFFAYTAGRKRLLFITGTIALLLGIMSVVFAYSAFAKASSDNPAIVFIEEVEIKSEPKLASTTAFTLHEGTKVQVLETVTDWSRIQLSDGKVGWIPSSDIKLLNNF